MKRPYRPWTPHDDKTIVELRESGTSQNMIATMMNRGRDAVHRRLRVLGVTTVTNPRARKWGKEDVAQAVEWKKHGLTYRQIGIRMGVSKNTVVGIFQRYVGVGPPRPRRVEALSVKVGPLVMKKVPLTPWKMPTEASSLIGPFIGIEMLNSHTCRYPIGDPRLGGAFGYCGQETREGSVYCSGHHAICTEVPDRQGKRKNRGFKLQSLGVNQ